MLNIRFSFFYFAILGSFFCFLGSFFSTLNILYFCSFFILFLIGVYDLKQKKHSVLKNYPIVGHFRYLIESIRPELRQYLFENDNEALPFSRAQRSIVYQRSKGDVEVLAFGTKIDVMNNGYEWLSHSILPSNIKNDDFRIEVGSERKKPYSLSVFNISAMSFGALSANAIKALNLGAKKGGFAHDTGEGSISKYHKEFNGDLIWEIGSGYFGCRDFDGNFNEAEFSKNANLEQVKMIEVKLSQGAKPGHGGVLPASKVTIEIAEARGVKLGEDCISPATHKEFSTPKEFILFMDKLRVLSNDKPVGFKFCVGHPWEFFSICKAMMELNIYPDFIVVDGGEGGTGAAPMEFADHVGTPLQEGLLLVHNTLIGLNIRDKIKIGASGKIITAFDMVKVFSLGADWVNSARGFLFSLGCIQGLSCNTGKCPTGIATQDQERQKALDVDDKSERVFRFHKNTLNALKELLSSSGLTHPSEINADYIMRRMSSNKVVPLSVIIKQAKKGELLNNKEYSLEVFEQWWGKSTSESFKVKNQHENI